MDHKIITAISIGFLFVAFGFVSFMVIITRRHPYFVARKLRLGALLISLSGASVGCFGATCYVEARSDVFHMDQYDSKAGAVVINRTTTDTITGMIHERRSEAYSYAILDSLDSCIIKDDILPFDGAYDENEEGFKIGFGHTVPPGSYNLNFYTIQKDMIQNFNWFSESFKLKVIE